MAKVKKNRIGWVTEFFLNRTTISAWGGSLAVGWTSISGCGGSLAVRWPLPRGSLASATRLPAPGGLGFHFPVPSLSGRPVLWGASLGVSSGPASSPLLLSSSRHGSVLLSSSGFAAAGKRVGFCGSPSALGSKTRRVLRRFPRQWSKTLSVFFS